jgi:hypothetical protein
MSRLLPEVSPTARGNPRKFLIIKKLVFDYQKLSIKKELDK